MPQVAPQTFSDATFQTSVSWQASRHLGVHFLTGRGFRAPNLNDLGALGLNDLGYEIPAAEAVPGDALLGNSAGEGAVPIGRRVVALRPESLMNYEAGFRVNAGRFYARAQVFDAEMSDPIVRRTMLFPAGSPPSILAGLPVTVIAPTAAQRTAGVVAVATAFDPRAVKAFVNDGQSRYTGTEALAQIALSSRWSARATYSFLAGRDLNPNRHIRRLPPQSGTLTLRYLHSRYWIEFGGSAAGAQRRLSGGDLDDERIGASRSRRDIADFFNGSRVRGVSPTGETLRQIQDRVLPIGSMINGVRVMDDATRVPLYTTTAGWVAFDIRSGVSLGERLSLLLGLTNLSDRNYRIHGSGIDAPGFGGHIQLSYRF
jgi:outer membrane receptor protein involved in Fe transport